MKTKVLLLSFITVFMVLWSVTCTAQKNKLPPPEMSSTNIPPPYGLPIDFGIPGVIAGGLIIGIYFLRNKKVKVPN